MKNNLVRPLAAAAFFILAAALSSCGSKCLRSHAEPVWVPDAGYFVNYGSGVSIWQTIPAHWGSETVCDVYEAKKR